MLKVGVWGEFLLFETNNMPGWSMERKDGPFGFLRSGSRIAQADK